MKLERIKLIGGIIIAAITIIGAVIGFDRYYAKSSDVKTVVEEMAVSDELVQERLDISITDDQIFQQQQQIQQMNPSE